MSRFSPFDNSYFIDNFKLFKFSILYINKRKKFLLLVFVILYLRDYLPVMCAKAARSPGDS